MTNKFSGPNGIEMRFKRPLTDEEIKSLTADPYQVFIKYHPKERWAWLRGWMRFIPFKRNPRFDEH